MKEANNKDTQTSIDASKRLGLDLAMKLFTKMSEQETMEQPIYLRITPKMVNDKGYLSIKFDSKIIELS